MRKFSFARSAVVMTATGVFMLAAVSAGHAQQPAANADADYLAKVHLAAPENVVNSATIVVMNKDGTMRTLQNGTNDFTCMLLDASTPMCGDKNAMAWAHALLTRTAPPDATGFMYMLNGDGGASNTDPFAKSATASNHWVKTGPHVMIVGSGAKSLGYPRTADADPTKPSVMWPGTPYEHVMIPVK